MSLILPLRDYQREAIDALIERWRDPLGRRTVPVVLPTGAGKTFIFAHLSAEQIRAHGGRVLVLAHTDELVKQAYREVRAIAPHLSVGIVKGTRNQVSTDVVVASVMSLRTAQRRDRIRNVKLVIVDECHRATAVTYRAILEHYGCLDGGATACAGFTATLVRGDKAKLSDVWSSPAYVRDISWMMRRGYLIPVKGKRIVIDELDTTRVKRSGGDLEVGALGEALADSLAPELVAKAIVEHAGERKGLLFAPTVASAEAFRDALLDQGIPTEVVHGNLHEKVREAILARLASGETRWVANCMVLTEGFNEPSVSCVAIARPTRSAGLYQQMVGRGLRVDKTIPRAGQDCLILQVVGGSEDHTLCSLVDLSTRPQVQVREDQYLVDAEDELDERGSGPLDEYEVPAYAGPVKVVDFDPLGSTWVWQETEGGTWFVTCSMADVGTVYVFLAPSAEVGLLDVAWATGDPKAVINGRNGGLSEHVGLDRDLAFGWAEDIANTVGREALGLNLRRSASWRSRSVSDAQRSTARRLGVVIPDGARCGDASDLIDARKASNRIDPIVTALRSAYGMELTSAL